MLENKLVATTFSASNSTLEEIYDAVVVVKFLLLMLSIVAKKQFPILLSDRLVGVAMGGQPIDRSWDCHSPRFRRPCWDQSRLRNVKCRLLVYYVLLLLRECLKIESLFFYT